MILIGERINGMFTDVKQAIADKNKKVIQDLARTQTQAGATYLDLNVGTAAADQEGTMKWLVETVQETCSTPLALDSQKPGVIKAGLDLSFSLPIKRSIVLSTSRTILDLCYEFYKNIDDVTLDYLILTNCLTSDDIIAVPRGKEIIFYE